ncbi:MAG: hypothetical protein Kow0029_21830 [Candidatus Rifleibacteriota bacterium]
MSLSKEKPVFSRFLEWLRFAFIALILPIAAVAYSLHHIENLQSEIRKKNFEISALDLLDKLLLAGNAEEFVCRRLSDIFEKAKSVDELKDGVVSFSETYKLELKALIWEKKGKVAWSTFDYKSIKADWQRAYNDLLKITKNQKLFLSEKEEENLRYIFGPHFFSRYHHHCYWDTRPKLNIGDSAARYDPSWVRAGRKFGLLVFIKPEKISDEIFLKKETLLAEVPENFALATLIGDQLVTRDNFFSKIASSTLKAIHNDFESQLSLGDIYICKNFIREGVTSLVAIQKKNLGGLRLTAWVMLMLSVFVLIIIYVAVLSFRSIVFQRRISINIRKQLVILFLLSNLFPLLTLGVLGYDYLVQYDGFLRNEALSRGLAYLQSIDEMYAAEFSYQLKKMNEAFKWLPDELKKSPPNAKMIRRLLATQSPEPFRLFLIGSHTQEVGSEMGIMRDGEFVEVIDENGAGYQSNRALVDALDRLGKYYLARLNGEILSEKAMLQIELIAESLGQIKPVEMVQEFFAATGFFWQWGMGKQYYPAHIRVLHLFDDKIADYVFLYLYKPHLLQMNYLERVFETINRNELGMKIAFVHESMAYCRPENFLEENSLREYSARLRGKSGNEIEYVTWKGKKHLAVGLKCMFLNQFRLVGLFPEEEITRKANEKYKLFMASGLLSLLVSLSLGLLVSRSFLVPLQELQKGVEALESRNFTYRLPDLGGDEFGNLASIFNSTLVDFEELQVASVVQEKLLPDISRNTKAGNFIFAGASVSLFRLGGDFYDHYPLKNGNELLAMGDVAGQGVGASLVMAFVKSCVLQLKSADLNPEEIVARVNKIICDTNTRKHRKFMTFQLLQMNASTSEILITNAGHCFPLLANINTGLIEILEMPSSPLGASLKSRLSSKKIDLAADEMLILYSGGVYRNPGLSFDEFVDLVKSRLEKDPANFCRNMIKAICSRMTRDKCLDDSSIMAIVRSECRESS